MSDAVELKCPRCKSTRMVPAGAILGDCPHCGEPYRTADPSWANLTKVAKSVLRLRDIGWFPAGGVLIGYCMFLFQLGCDGTRTGQPATVTASERNSLDRESIQVQEGTSEPTPKEHRGFDALPDDSQQPVTATGARSQSRSMSFEQCLTLIDGVSADIGEQPLTIAATSDLMMVKWFTDDGAVLVTCSRPDEKMVYTVSPDQ